MADHYVRDLPLEIEEPIEDVVVKVNGDAMFECKVTGSPAATSEWYRNGEPISEDDTTTIRVDGCWHRLELTCVSARHYGLYTVLCKNEYYQVTSQAVLHVTPEHTQQAAYYTYTIPNTPLVTKHLIGNYLAPGDRVDLKVAFQSNIEDIKWFRNNQLIKLDDRIKVTSGVCTSSLVIDSAKTSDSGFYSVEARTECGLATSFANVQVIEKNDKLKSNDLELPYIEVVLPEELEATAGDEIRLLCKARMKETTDVVWYKKGVKIIHDEKTFVEFLVNNYICLRIVDADKSDSGEYTIILRDANGVEVDSSTCFVTVNSCMIADLPVVHVRRPLEAALALVGQQMAFDCTFELRDPRYYFVVWRIAHMRILRSTTHYNVVTFGGDSMLYIKCLEPWMTGRVICELRKANDSNSSLLVNSTSTYLGVVTYLEQWETTHERQRVYREVFSSYYSNARTEIINDSTWSPIEYSVFKPPEVLLEINYCRLEDQGFFFLRAWNWTRNMPEKVYVQYRTEWDAVSDVNTTVAIIEWSENHCYNYWFLVELSDETGKFTAVGESSFPLVEIQNPVPGRLMRFRVRVIDRPNYNNQATLSVAPTPLNSRPPIKEFQLKSITDYNNDFGSSTNLLGSGAFGSVYLVQDKNGELYAAKMLKTRTQKKKEMAKREYENMKLLHHPKLVEMFQGYWSKELMIIVMDFLWGGELFERMVQEDHFKEADVVPYVHQICEGVKFLHDNKLAHLDLKPENIVCLSPNSRQIKLIDFGLARILSDKQPVRAIYGTREYVAPEVLNFDSLTLQCDMWSVGVVTYVLLSGVIPFTGETWPERSANITSAKFNFEESAFRDVSNLAKDFVSKLLKLKPETRLTADQALTHEWLVQGPPRGASTKQMKKTKNNLISLLANHRARWQVSNELQLILKVQIEQSGECNDCGAPPADRAGPSREGGPANHLAANRAGMAHIQLPTGNVSNTGVHCSVIHY